MMKTLFNIAKQPQGLVKMLDQYLLQKDKHVDDGDRKSVTNSPSSALGCIRANYYQRQGIVKDIIEPRLRRIFDNGHGVHERLQTYLKDAGILFMDEVPLHNEDYEIQGHTDGIMSLSKSKKEVQILEIKSMNTMQFSKLREPKTEHRAQAQVYIFCSEQHRLYLQCTYKTVGDFNRSKLKRRKYYASLYQHLTDGTNYTREQKIKHKVDQHMLMDTILFEVKKPITQAVVLYEDKNTQDLKEFLIDIDEQLMSEVLNKYEESNVAWENQELPCRECKSKSEGRWCNYVQHCFE